MKQAHLFKILLGTIVLVSTIQNVHANCATTGVGNATGGGDTVQCSLFDNNGHVGTGSGDDITILTGSNTTNNIDTINGAAGADIITVLGGTITSIIAGDAILGGPGNDVIVVNAGVINGVNHGINGATGQDTITINGGTITAINNAAIRGASGADTITLNGGKIVAGTNGFAINTNNGNDSVIIAGNIDITGDINGGNGTDTLTFSMAVPGGNIQALQLALNSANPALGSIIINGQTYSWLNFESINHNLSVRVHSIPTLSEWAILLLIALLGFIGFKRTNEHRSSPKT